VCEECEWPGRFRQPGFWAKNELALAPRLALVRWGLERDGRRQCSPDWFFGGLIMDLEELPGRPVDIATEASLHPSIRERILGEAVPL